METFEKYSRFEKKMPPESGAYNIVIISRDGEPVINVAYYDAETKKWYAKFIQEYGYAEERPIEDNNIQYYKSIEGVAFAVVPETYTIVIPGVAVDDE